jgi:hypothetical protein
MVTSLLVTCIVLLLIGMAMQLPTPAPPDSFMGVPYSTLRQDRSWQ